MEYIIVILLIFAIIYMDDKFNYLYYRYNAYTYMHYFNNITSCIRNTVDNYSYDIENAVVWK